jgi:glycosyltransferase involved in cell wall biosynthesis
MRAQPVRILALPRQSRTGASTRYRFLQYLPHLEQQGFRVDVVPFFDDAYLRERYRTGSRSLFRAIPAYMARLFRLLQGNAYDLIWVEKETFPWLPWALEAALLPRHIPLVADYDDAEFHRYDQHPSTAVRRALGRKIDAVMARASLVLAGNEFIARRAESSGATRVAILPTVVELANYPASRVRDSRPFTIGWIGTPITSPFLRLARPALQDFCRRHDARVLLIGSGAVDLGIPVEVRPWSEATEVQDLAEFDVGMMPLDDTPFSRGKCGLKLLQSMACWQPVVGTPVGVNAQIIRHGTNGFHARTCAEWLQALETLYQDKALRERFGNAGRQMVEARYSVDAVVPALCAELHRAARSERAAVTTLETAVSMTQGAGEESASI